MDRRLQRRHRHAHIRGIGRDAMIASAQNRKRAIVTSDRWAATAWLALVAGHGCVAEVHAACALQQVATNCCHVADLG